MPLTLAEALEHVGYEWRMFRQLGSILALLPRSDDPIRDALVESLVVHARNLSEFFFDDGNGRAIREPLGLAPEATPGEVATFLTQANNHVAHLSPRRTTKRDWDYVHIAAHFERRLGVLRATGNVPANWDGDRNVEPRLLRWPDALFAGGAVGPAAYNPFGGCIGATGAAGQ